MSYTVQLDNYQGPLDLLLQLIERNQLDICEVSLAQVTNDYIGHVERLQLPLHERNWFADIASRLVLVKSRALLPNQSIATAEDTEVEDDLTEQLELYKLYRNASQALQKLAKTPSYARTQTPLVTTTNHTYKNLTAEQLQASFEQALTQLQHKQSVEKSFGPRRGSFQKVRGRAMTKLAQFDKFELPQLWKLADGQFELIIYFLCLLELIRSGDLQFQPIGTIVERVYG